MDKGGAGTRRRTRAEIKAAIGAKFEKTRREAHVPDQVMVSADAAALDVMNDGLGYTVLRPLRHTDYHLVRIPTGRTVESAVDELADLPGVEDVEADSIAEPGAEPNDPLWANDLVTVVGEVEYRYASQKRLTKHMDVDAYWDRLARYPGLITPNVIAVIDSGFDIIHEDLAGQFVLPGYNSADGGADIAPGTTGAYYHGTTVAGIINAVTNNEQGIAGLAPHSKVYPIKYLTATIPTSVSTMAAGIEHAVSKGIRVINLSSGFASGSTALEQACNSAKAAGCILVSIAHNDGTAAVRYPGKYDSVICIAGLEDESLEIASSSNYGAGVDFCASYRLLTTITYPGVEPPYYLGAGTSMAAPQIAALIGTMLAFNPALTWDDVYNMLTRSCIPETPRGGTRYGHGIPQFGEALGYAIEALPYSGYYMAGGYVDGLYRGNRQGVPVRLGRALIGDENSRPKTFWVGTA